MIFDADALHELSASIREHGVLQPILVRPLGSNRYQLVAGERRWRAAKEAGLATIPALVEELDDDTALEISIIENLQREDLSPLEEAAMYDRMVREHGYSIRKLAEKLGKDKGYLENRLRLADAPGGDPRAGVCAQRHPVPCVRAAQGRQTRRSVAGSPPGSPAVSSRSSSCARRSTGAPLVQRVADAPDEETDQRGVNRGWTRGRGLTDRRRSATGPASVGTHATASLTDDSLVQARHQLADAVEELVAVLRAPDVVRSIPEVDRANLAKYLTIAKLKLENAIAMVRSGDTID